MMERTIIWRFNGCYGLGFSVPTLPQRFGIGFQDVWASTTDRICDVWHQVFILFSIPIKYKSFPRLPRHIGLPRLTGYHALPFPVDTGYHTCLVVFYIPIFHEDSTASSIITINPRWEHKSLNIGNQNQNSGETSRFDQIQRKAGARWCGCHEGRLCAHHTRSII